ncbi:hypothetical protein J437_LFUL007791 [Ladona fulva]|uniref:G-protein coupled receptors family 1 profile domain-containing protein n=1 Tax=Ladona fulva TaxID=123851 RepID=A0A8K0JSM0_LADFU|nr:hypothetical protein J437_LFUL007791 [Ladona fulva]
MRTTEMTDDPRLPFGSNTSIEGCTEECVVIYSASPGVVALLSLCYGLLSIAAVGGNALVIWAVFGSRRMRKSTTNFYIANLALADITIGLFCIPFQFQAALLQRWDLPWFMCGFCPFIQVLSVNVSIFTLTAIAVDRHKAIVNPLSGVKSSASRARTIIATIWSFAGALALPMAMALGVTESPVGLPEELTKPFCSNVGLSTGAMMAYRHALVAVQYVCPLAVISVAYARVGMRLYWSETPGTAQRRRDAHMLRHKKKVK